MPCKKCNHTLMFGQSMSPTLFCPNCEGINVITQSRALEMIGRQNKELAELCLDQILKFNADWLIMRLISYRERYLQRAKNHELDFEIFMSITKATYDAMKYGSTQSKLMPSDTDSEFLTLLQSYYLLIKNENFYNLIKNGYGHFIEIPPNINIQTYFLDDTSTYGTENRIVGKLNEYWCPVLENIRLIGLITKTDVENEYTAGKYPMEGKPVRDSDLNDRLKLMCGLELGYLDIKFNQINDYGEIDDELIELVNTVMQWSYHSLYESGKVLFEPRTGLLLFYPKEILLNLMQLWKIPDDLITKFDKQLISSKLNPKAISFIFEVDGNLFLPPFSLNMMKMILKIKKEQGTMNDMRSNFGIYFESIVERYLLNAGFSYIPPNNLDRYYKNYIDDPIYPSIEIDALVIKQNNIFVIECKGWLPNPKFLLKGSTQKRKNELEQESIKQLKRMEYVHSNLTKLGYNEDDIIYIHNVILTWLNEPTSKIGDCSIISFQDISKLDDLIMKKA